MSRFLRVYRPEQREELADIEEQFLFPHNLKAYRAAVSMMDQAGKSAIIHPTGTGKSFIGFQLCAENPEKRVLWLSPSEYIFKTQQENWYKAGGGLLNNLTFMTYARLMTMTSAGESSKADSDRNQGQQSNLNG